MPRPSRRLVAVLVAFAILLLGTMEVAAQSRELEGSEKAISHTRIIPADEPYNQTFEWRAKYVRLPSPFSEPVVLLGLAVRSDVDAPSGTHSDSPLNIEATVFLNDQEDASMTFTFGFGHFGVSNVWMPDPEADHAWRYGENDIRVVVTVQSKGILGAEGSTEVELGPLTIDKKQ